MRFNQCSVTRKMTTRTSCGEGYVRLVYERILVRSVLEQAESGNAAPRAAHKTAKRMATLRLEKSMVCSEHGGNEAVCVEFMLYTCRVA